MHGERHDNRTILAIGGEERVSFLQGLVSNDVAAVAEGIVYAALLTPQGKYLSDFFLVDDGARILLDVATEQAPDLAKRLKMYKLRANVTIEETGLCALRGLGPVPEGGWPDPRHPALGWRCYVEDDGSDAAPGTTDWDAIRVAHCVPETGIELIPNETYILEAGFEKLSGVDFRKGCYVGQEVTARMKHKTALRKGFARVDISGDAPPPGTEILRDGKSVGTLYTASGAQAIAFLRFDRAGDGMEAADASVSWAPDPAA